MAPYPVRVEVRGEESSPYRPQIQDTSLHRLRPNPQRIQRIFSSAFLRVQPMSYV
uniref:Uncharacterized protein n=1 Tax=Anguilla anguilla TaxID=7936 RepID=A0A0E9WAQ4_ANGAN